MKPLNIQLSALDKQVPDGVTVMIRITERISHKGPPRSLGDFANIEDAQKYSNGLVAVNRHHSYLTWWRNAEGKHVHKWATIMKGKRRHFKVSLPYAPGISDEMVKAYITEALLDVAERPMEYTKQSVTVRVDPDANRLEADMRWVQIRVSEQCAEAIAAMAPTIVAHRLEQAILATE